MNLTGDQRLLSELMSEISEEWFCAGWIIDLEYTLWTVVTNPTARRQFGMEELSAHQIAQLKSLSESIGGWIMWDDPVGEVFVPMREWLTIYDKAVAA